MLVKIVLAILVGLLAYYVCQSLIGLEHVLSVILGLIAGILVYIYGL